MKLYKIFAIVAFAGMTVSCGDDFLTSNSTQQPLAGAAATEGAVLSYLGSAYQILLHDSYANQNYNSIVLMSDLRSDDIYKGGGDASDQSTLYSLSLFRISPSESLSGLWSIYFTGIARCNNTIIACENAVGFDSDVAKARLAQYKAEALFLRAYYTHLLWKFFGNVPYFTEPLTGETNYMAPQYSADEIYGFIMADIDAIGDNDLPMRMTGANLGRVSKAAVSMLKARVVMYQKDESRYDEVAADMAEIINSGDYDLVDDFDAMWADAGEFGIESIFESNQLPEGKGWSNGWNGYGTNLPAFISPNELKDPNGVYKGGWAFGPVRAELPGIFEAGDTRLTGSINDWNAAEYVRRFQDTGYFMRKYAARVDYNPPPGDQDLNYCNNLRIFRYAEALLNYAELVGLEGAAPAGGVDAQACLDEIRARAFGDTSHSITLTWDNLKLERRREFIGEGMRFWDLVRWGDAASVLTEDIPAFGSTRTFNPAKDKYLPIPQGEMDKTKGFGEFELVQNPNY